MFFVLHLRAHHSTVHVDDDAARRARALRGDGDAMNRVVAREEVDAGGHVGHAADRERRIDGHGS